MKRIAVTIFTLLVSLASFATIGTITGDTVVCIGSPAHLTDTTAGGIWSSSDTIIATVDSYGRVTGVATGTATITYSVGISIVTKIITVYPAPAPITGNTIFCEGGTTTLYDTTAGGGYWYDDPYSGPGSTPVFLYSSNYNSAVIGAHGTWTPYGDIITFVDTFGCSTSIGVDVDPLPPPITGNTNTYLDSTTILSDSWSGGTWSSSNTAVATISSSSGIVTSMSTGTTTIYYTRDCSTSTIVTVFRAVEVPTLLAQNHSEIVLYPNPAIHSLTITSSDKITSIIINNLVEQTVYSNSYHDQEVQVDVSGLPAGMYLVRINGTEVRKFVKE